MEQQEQPEFHDGEPEQQQVERPQAQGQTVRRRQRPPGLLAEAPVSWLVLICCLLSFLYFNVLHPDQLMAITFSPGNGLLFPGLLSHIFAHQDAAHLFFNMFMLMAIGRLVERGYGLWRYSAVFFGSGLVAALSQAAVQPEGFLLGASGALSGVLAVFIRHLPNAQLLLFGVIPMPAWVLGLLWLGYNLYGAASGGGHIAFMAHLGGFLGGFALSFLLVPPRFLRSRHRS